MFWVRRFASPTSRVCTAMFTGRPSTKVLSLRSPRPSQNPSSFIIGGKSDFFSSFGGNLFLFYGFFVIWTYLECTLALKVFLNVVFDHQAGDMSRVPRILWLT